MSTCRRITGSVIGACTSLVHTKLLIDFLVLQVPYSEFLCTPCDTINRKIKINPKLSIHHQGERIPDYTTNNPVQHVNVCSAVVIRPNYLAHRFSITCVMTTGVYEFGLQFSHPG